MKSNDGSQGGEARLILLIGRGAGRVLVSFAAVVGVA